MIAIGVSKLLYNKTNLKKFILKNVTIATCNKNSYYAQLQICNLQPIFYNVPKRVEPIFLELKWYVICFAANPLLSILNKRINIARPCNYFSLNLRCVCNNKAHIKFGSGAISFRWNESKHRYQILPSLLLLLLPLRISELQEIWSYIERGSKYRARNGYDDELSFRLRIRTQSNGRFVYFIRCAPAN